MKDAVVVRKNIVSSKNGGILAEVRTGGTNTGPNVISSQVNAGDVIGSNIVLVTIKRIVSNGVVRAVVACLLRVIVLVGKGVANRGIRIGELMNPRSMTMNVHNTSVAVIDQAT